MDELKPCPFCGGKAILSFGKNNHMSHRIWVSCTKCYVSFSGYSPNLGNPQEALENIERCRVKAAEQWNRRASDDK